MADEVSVADLVGAVSTGVVEELTVETLAFGGDGVAHRADGQVVFVRRCAPGDRLLARIDRDRGSYARASPVRLLESGAERRVPPCGYFDRCGGCQLQHVSLAGQREAKRAAVRDALRRIGRRRVDVPELVHAGGPLGYRNRVTFTLRRSAGGVLAGYHGADDPAELTDVADCPLAEDAVREAWASLRAGWGEAAESLPAGDELRVTVRASATGGVALFVEGGSPGRAGRPDAVVDAVDALRSYHWKPAGAPRVLLAGAPRFADRWRGLDFELGPESFLQVNRAVAERMEDYIDGQLGDVAGVRILDLYSGVGGRAVSWAARGADVAACELDGDAIESGRLAARAAGSSPTLHQGRVEEWLPRLLPAEVIVVNPPRRGLSPAVCEPLAVSGARRLVYVSCDPATLARDLARLGDGWAVHAVQPFDAFPHTYHVETVAVLRPAAARREGGSPGGTEGAPG